MTQSISVNASNESGALASKKIAYSLDNARSRQLNERASKVMPGGNTRHSIALSPYPVYAVSGRGCRVTDVDGEERIDFLNNFTSLILGHADPEVVKAIHREAVRGTAFSMPTELDVELAELMVERVAYIDQIRFCNSGSEAVMLAVKTARAFTGRSKIAKFEGAYHGIYDYVQVSEGPTPEDWGDSSAPHSVLEASSAPNIAQDVVILPWNGLEACRRLIAANKDSLAAVIVDPLPGGIGMIAPQPGFLEFLREESERHGILLIADEVMSFRLSYHGAMHESGIAPDLTAFGKIIGGGLPVGAVGGRREVMAVFDHTGSYKVHHGGTFNANPMTMAAGLETMRKMTPDAFDRLNSLGDQIREQLARLFRDRAIPARVCGKGSLFLVHLTDEELVDYRSLKGFSRTKPIYGAFCHEMLAEGIMTSPRGIFGCLSAPMTQTELGAFVSAVDKALAHLAYRA